MYDRTGDVVPVLHAHLGSRVTDVDGSRELLKVEEGERQVDVQLRAGSHVVLGRDVRENLVDDLHHLFATVEVEEQSSLGKAQPGGDLVVVPRLYHGDGLLNELKAGSVLGRTQVVPVEAPPGVDGEP